MKTIAPLALAAIVTGLCCAEDGQHKIKIIKLTSLIQETPQFQVAGVKGKRINPRYWLELEAELEVKTTAPSEFIPVITAHWFAVVKNNFSKPNAGQPVRLTGRVEFLNIRTKDRTIHISAYIGPDVLEKLTGKDRPNESDIEGIALKIEGNGIVTDKKEYVEGLVKATAEKKSRWWEKWGKKTLPDAILAKSKTPFALLWTDRYPAEKLEH